jgi:hypothetical protein
VLTDWPGHRPRALETFAVLVAAGADVNARFGGSGETPLMWAASADDVAMIDALLDAGADIEARGAVTGGGTALDDAWAFGQWEAARLLVSRGARPTLLAAAALGLDVSGPGDVTQAFWAACHGGQRGSAEALPARGADPSWVGWEGLTPAQAARREGHEGLADWISNRTTRVSTSSGFRLARPWRGQPRLPPCCRYRGP